MGNDEREVDEKLYRVVRKKGSHVNTKVNPDGTKSALQFTDDNNDLTEPVDLIEVDEGEYIRAEDVHNYSYYDTAPRTWEQVIVEDSVVPVAREAIEQLLNIGLQHFDVWMEEKAIPTAKQKQRRLGRIYLSSSLL